MKPLRSLLLLASVAGALSAAPPVSTFETAVKPFLATNCIVCHSEKTHTAELNLQAFQSAQDVDAKRDAWETIVRRVRSGEMPPKGFPRPKQEQIDAFTQWVDTEFERLDASQAPDPGRVTARRLNKFEYNNTVRDLLAVKFQPAKDFPADDSGYGFDNIGDVLSLSPILMEKYLSAAEKIARDVLPVDPLPKPIKVRLGRKGKPHPLPDTLDTPANFIAEGDYAIQVNVAGRRIPLTLSLDLDGKQVGTFEVPFEEDRSRTAEFKLHVPYGEHKLIASLVEDDFRQAPPPKPAKPNDKPIAEPNIGFIEVKGPYNPLPPPPTESYKTLFACGHPRGQHKPECGRIALTSLAKRAYRRPVTTKEIDGLMRFVKLAQDRGDGFDEGMRLGMEAVLVSPYFLFRIEHDAKASDPAAKHEVTDFELASRLSYFLWSSMPDAELFRLAEQRGLRKPGVLEAQVRRMLAGAKASALVENFAGQWLELRNLNSVKPDPEKFPGFNDALRADMKKETELFVGAIFRNNGNILDMLDGRYSFLNERLAKFYGIDGVSGPDFRRVEFTGNPQRSGVLTQASLLTVSSYGNRTSPVIRGKYILENFLNDPPPPPPPGVPALDEAAAGLTQSMRKQLEAHRANPACASCHSRMDPLGFGLENYNAIGQWRDADGKFPIDSTGTLPNGKSFATPSQMKEILKGNAPAFAKCLTEKLMTYGLGRGLERFDRPAVAKIQAETVASGYHFETLIVGIVKSMPFQMRRGDGTKMQMSLAKATTVQAATQPRNVN